MIATPVTVAPSLTIVSRAPFVVTGTHFRPSERVTLKVGTATFVVRTTRTGAFRESMAGVLPDRCSGITALGARGDHAALPARTMCAPAGTK